MSENLPGSDVEKKSKIPSQAPRGVPVGPKVRFKPVKQLYRLVSKKNNINGNKKKDMESTKEVSNSNPFDVLNSVENGVGFGTNRRTLNLPMRMKLLTDNEMANFLASERVGYLLEQWRETYENTDYDNDLYDDDMYEGQKIPDNIQSICNNLDIKLRGRKKK
ncbi:hypothetical protein Tco_0766771 [Tanacetum coccineum]